jgi:hypothetical protein
MRSLPPSDNSGRSGDSIRNSKELNILSPEFVQEELLVPRLGPEK